MISLTQKDIQHTFGKFLVTAVGVGILLGVVMIMIGVYRGMIIDAEVLVKDIGADLWIVQENTLGPFAEPSRIHEDLKERIRAAQGIEKAEAMTFQNIQLPGLNAGMSVRVVAVGYDPLGSVNPISPQHLVAGRRLKKVHYEIVVSDKTGYDIGDTLLLLRHFYRVVGVTHGTVSSAGIPLVYLSLRDAQELQFSYSNERIRNDRARGLKNSGIPLANVVVAKIRPGYESSSEAEKIAESFHKSVYTEHEQIRILTKNLIKMASKQIGMFTVILIIVSMIIIALIIYTMTLEKMKVITIMKLIGIPDSMIIKMIVQETLILGLLAFVFGSFFAHMMDDKFPKRVVLEASDDWTLFGIVIIASILASFAAVKKVIHADPGSAIGG